MATSKSIIIRLLAILCINCAIGSEIGVPVLLWQSTADPHLKTVLDDRRSTVNQIDAQVLADDYIGETETVVAFVQSSLSLEQFTVEDEDKLTSVKKILTDHSTKPTLLIDVLNPVRALSSRGFRTEQLDRLNVKNGHKVYIELPNDSLVDNNELLAQLMADIQKNVSKNTLFLITGHKNLIASIDLEADSAVAQERHKRAAEPEPEPEAEEEDNVADGSVSSINDTNLLAFEDCIFFYTNRIVVKVYNLTNGANREVQELATYLNFSEPLGANRTLNRNASRCWLTETNNDTHTTIQLDPAELDITYIDHNQTELKLHFKIDSPYFKNTSDFWHLNETTATLKFRDGSEWDGKGGEFNLIVNQTGAAEERFGFSCNSLTLLSEKRNLTEAQKDEGLIQQISIEFSRFQFQPFKNPYNSHPDQRKYVFAETYDCEVWFTLPLWMGLLTLLVLFTILFIGVYFVSTINTPDRFENPKGKPLIIANVDE